jgi:hypothetical protein
MAQKSPFLLVKQLEGDMLRLLSHLDIPTLSTKEQHTVAQLKNALIDAKLEIQDYELAETRDHQLRNAKHAKGYLQNVEKLMATNPAGAFGAVDVAHLTAYIGQITDKLK